MLSLQNVGTRTTSRDTIDDALRSKLGIKKSMPKSIDVMKASTYLLVYGNNKTSEKKYNNAREHRVEMWAAGKFLAFLEKSKLLEL